MDVAGGADNAVMTSNPPPAQVGPDQDAPMPTDKLGTDAFDHSMHTTSLSSEEGTPMALYVLGAAALATIVYLIVK